MSGATAGPPAGRVIEREPAPADEVALTGVSATSSALPAPRSQHMVATRLRPAPDWSAVQSFSHRPGHIDLRKGWALPWLKVCARCFPMTHTTHTGTAPIAVHHCATSGSWLETAICVLSRSPWPLSSRQIVVAAEVAGCVPASRTRTPAQSVNRDINAALRRGDVRVLAGRVPGQFYAAGAGPACGPAPAPAPAPRRKARTGARLPIEPLAQLVAARGGLWACGVAHRPGDPLDRVRWVARIQRAYLRARLSGWVSQRNGDEMAVKLLLLHPVSVWGSDWWDA